MTLLRMAVLTLGNGISSSVPLSSTMFLARGQLNICLGLNPQFPFSEQYSRLFHIGTSKFPDFPPTVLTRVDMHATSGSTSKISPWEDLSKTLSPAFSEWLMRSGMVLCRVDLSVWMVGNYWLWSKQISDQWGEPMQEFSSKTWFICTCFL